jgi:hypothetical protein
MRKILALGVAFGLLSGCTTQPTAPAQSTDLKPSIASTSGFGGTGRMAEEAPQPLAAAHVRHTMELDSGFGGTGHTSNGFGGTGIVGPIEQFGSIWVNGIEVGLGQKTQIFSNLPGQESALSAADLRLGQQVWLETHPNEDQTTTAEIHIYYPLAGRIERIRQHDAGSELLVNGQRVYLDQSTHLDAELQLKEGTYVRISGLPIYQTGSSVRENAWQATLVEPQTETVSWLKAVPDVQFSEQVHRVVMQDSWLTAYRAGELVNLKKGLSTQPKIKLLGNEVEAAKSGPPSQGDQAAVNGIQAARSGLSGTGRSVDSLHGLTRTASGTSVGSSTMSGNGRR